VLYRKYTHIPLRCDGINKQILNNVYSRHYNNCFDKHGKIMGPRTNEMYTQLLV